MMILAPSKLFLDYISDVLPELGVEDVTQTTFQDFFQEAMGKKFTFTKSDEKLLKLVEGDPKENLDTLSWVAQFKGSMLCKELIDRYAADITANLIVEEDLKLDRFVLFEGKKVKALFEEQYAYMPPFQRIEKMKKVISNHVKTKKKDILQKVEDIYDSRIEKIRYSVKDPEKRREKIVNIMDQKEEYIQTLKKESKNIVNPYVKKFTKKDIHTYYKDLMTNENLLLKYGDGSISKKEAKLLASYNKSVLKGKKIEEEDAAALLYTKYLLAGVKETQKIKNIVIDEAQDYSLFEFYTLKKVTNTELFTILGDLSQGIHSYRSIMNWDEVIENVFNKATYTTLEQSYRTTQEIMEQANMVIQYSKAEGLPFAKPVVRHGDEPNFHLFDTSKDAALRIQESVFEYKQIGHQSIAIIGKTQKECSMIHNALKKYTGISSKELEENEHLEEGSVHVVPSYLSKGLEFDAVILVTDKENYNLDNELDIKLLYVAMTRALHDLDIFLQRTHHSGILKQLLNQSGIKQ
ncbi:HelD family protein [Alteribacillus bidgolensis]|uniref:DNA helicase-2 / ATP-dependent DNA helicase PcrA n=1 Tax=Alteribacillus bidgolensis TaxID=930129 RepID=A0A1G8R2M3_9BACI|nr:3'-5' exonuclease [Alteribacillus bidgolensis]SDJ11093.1 DNA helicase-2 / ATP-dependent DNA helicase PcrA [Alteribacillus bidgolensis]